MMERSKKTLFFISLGFLTLCFVVLSLLSIFLIRNIREDSSKRLYNYHYLEVNNNHQKKVFEGTISHPKHLKKNEYMIYENKDKNILISNFCGTKFECVGSCYCDQPKRSTSSSVTTTGIRTLLVSISTVIAYKLAQSHFEEKCVERESETCSSPSNIHAKVEDCHILMSNEENEDGVLCEEDVEVKRTEFKKEKRKFLCFGHCVPSETDDSQRVDEKLRKNVVCSNIKNEAEIEVSESGMPVYATENSGGEGRFGFIAMLEFRRTHMTKFCRTNSLVEFGEEKISVCEGTVLDSQGRYGSNVNCREVGCGPSGCTPILEKPPVI